MSEHWDNVAAAKAKADAPRLRVADFVEDIVEDPEAVQVDAWAEMMIARGMERRAALLAASDIWESQRKKDAECVQGLVGYPAESLRVMAIRIKQAPKPRFSAGCLLLAIGMDDKSPTVGSVRSWAKQQGVTPEHAANEVEAWQGVLGLPRTSAQKSERARKVYRATNGAQLRHAA